MHLQAIRASSSNSDLPTLYQQPSVQARQSKGGPPQSRLRLSNTSSRLTSVKSLERVPIQVTQYAADDNDYQVAVIPQPKFRSNSVVECIKSAKQLLKIKKPAGDSLEKIQTTEASQ